jgi:hypothetical protein
MGRHRPEILLKTDDKTLVLDHRQVDGVEDN